MLIGHLDYKLRSLRLFSQHGDWWVRSACVILLFQNHGLQLMLFLVDGDLADGCCRVWVWAVGVQDETKHLLGPSDPSQAPVNCISERKDYYL